MPEQSRFTVMDRFASTDAWPYYIMDRLTGERDFPTDFKELAEIEVKARNQMVTNGEYDA